MSNTYSFTVTASDVQISPHSHQEVELTFEIYKSTVDDIFNNLPDKELIQQLEKSVQFTPQFCLNQFDFSIEDFFDLFDKSELKHRVAQYLINNE